MAAVTICSDFWSPQKVWHCFHCFPIYFPWSDGTRCHDLRFLNVEGRANAPVIKNNMSPYQVESWRNNAGRVCKSQTKVSEVFTSRETKTWPLKDLYGNCYSRSPVLMPACRVPWQAASTVLRFFIHCCHQHQLQTPGLWKVILHFFFLFGWGTWLLGS